MSAGWTKIARLKFRLELPVIDRMEVSGVGGVHKLNVHLAQIHVPSLKFTIPGKFAGVQLMAGGQGHHALIGRTFLQNFYMVYDGPEGSVKIAHK